MHAWYACMISHFSHVWLFTAPCTVACQAPLSMGFSRQEYWSVLPFPPPGDLPIQGSNPHLLHLLHWQVGSLPLVVPGKPHVLIYHITQLKHLALPSPKSDFKYSNIHCSAAAAAAKSLQSCPTLCNPRDGSPSGSPSLGLSRQEHWSELSFPSPMHESEKWKWSRSVMSDPQRPHGLQPTRLLHPWDFPGKSTGVLEWGAIAFSQAGLPGKPPILL